MDQSGRILSLRLLNSRERPFLHYHSGQEDVIALIDTGALTPVWCMGERKFIRAYPDAEKKDEVCHISGFGETPIVGSVFIIPNFVLKSGECEYRVKQLQVAVCDHPQIGCDFVLSDTIFSQTDMYLVRRGDRRVEFYFDKDEIRCTPRYMGNSFTVSTWTQD